METTPPLPSGFNINGYLIQSLKQTDALCHVYYASDANHVQYLVREFCPQGLAVRDPESGKLRYPETTDIEQEVLPLKNDFEAQFRTGSLGEIPALGTMYLVYALPGVHPAAEQSPLPATPVEPLQRDQRTLATPAAGAPPVHAVPLSQPRKKKSSAGIWILILILLGGACAAYYYTQKPAEDSAAPQEPSSTQPKKEKKEAPKPEKKAALPAAEVEDPFEQESAAAEAPPGGAAEQPEETPSASAPEEQDEDGSATPAEEPAPEPEQPAGEADAPADDATAAEQPEPETPTKQKDAPALPSNPPPPAVRAEKPPGRPPTWETSTPT